MTEVKQVWNSEWYGNLARGIFDTDPNTPSAGILIGTPQFALPLLVGVTDGVGVASISTYQWRVDGLAIAGQTSVLFAPKVGDIGKIVSAVVTYTDKAGVTKTVTGTAKTAVLETVLGTAANDNLAGGPGNDTLSGLGGLDTAHYAGARTGYEIKASGSNFTARDTDATNGDEGIDTLVGVERLRFTDKIVALDIAGNAGQAYRVYQAAFDRKPDAGGLKYWVDAMDTGTSLLKVSEGFVGSAEFQALYGSNPTNADFITKLYTNVLHRAPEQGGYDWWLSQMNQGLQTKVSALANFAESAENQLGVIGSIQNGIELPLI